MGQAVSGRMDKAVSERVNQAVEIREDGPDEAVSGRSDCPTGRRTTLQCYLSIGRMVRLRSDGPSLVVKHTPPPAVSGRMCQIVPSSSFSETSHFYLKNAFSSLSSPEN